MTQEQVQHRGGPSVASLRNIEKGVARPRQGTLVELDNALAWKPGTSRRIVEGTADPDPTTWNETSRRYTVGTAGEVDSVARRSAELADSTSEVEQLAREVTDSAQVSDSAQVVKVGPGPGPKHASGIGHVELGVQARAQRDLPRRMHLLTVQTPRRVAEDRIQEVRRSRGWSHEQLAQQCVNIGAYEMTAKKIEDIESHELGMLDLNDVMAICYALDVAPVYVLAPIEDDPDSDDHRIQVSQDRYLKPEWFREWIRGTWAPSDIDWSWYFWNTRPQSEWHPQEPTDDQIARATEAVRVSRKLETMTQPHRAHPDFENGEE